MIVPNQPGGHRSGMAEAEMPRIASAIADAVFDIVPAHALSRGQAAIWVRAIAGE